MGIFSRLKKQARLSKARRTAYKSTYERERGRQALKIAAKMGKKHAIAEEKARYKKTKAHGMFIAPKFKQISQKSARLPYLLMQDTPTQVRQMPMAAAVRKKKPVPFGGASVLD